MIKDSSATWQEYLGENEIRFGWIKTFIYLKVKMVFDPPLSSSVIDSYNRTLSELEWRITVGADELVSNQGGA